MPLLQTSKVWRKISRFQGGLSRPTGRYTEFFSDYIDTDNTWLATGCRRVAMGELLSPTLDHVQ